MGFTLNIYKYAEYISIYKYIGAIHKSSWDSIASKGNLTNEFGLATVFTSLGTAIQ